MPRPGTGGVTRLAVRERRPTEEVLCSNPAAPQAEGSRPAPPDQSKSYGTREGGRDWKVWGGLGDLLLPPHLPGETGLDQLERNGDVGEMFLFILKIFYVCIIVLLSAVVIT